MLSRLTFDMRKKKPQHTLKKVIGDDHIRVLTLLHIHACKNTHTRARTHTHTHKHTHTRTYTHTHTHTRALRIDKQYVHAFKAFLLSSPIENYYRIYVFELKFDKESHHLCGSLLGTIKAQNISSKSSLFYEVVLFLWL